MKSASLNFLTALVICAFPGAPAPAASDPLLSVAKSIAIEPCSASLAGGTVRLATTGLQRQAGRFTGNYELKVVPYFFKSENGTVSISVAEESLRKLAAGSTVNLAGKVVTSGSGKTRAIRVKATPTGVDAAKGTATISISTENGELVFATEYTFGR